MAEQISHKKSLRVERLNQDKKRLLKDYYKLDNEPEPVVEESAELSVEPTTTNIISQDNDHEDSDRKTPVDTMDKPIEDLTLKQLVQIHNHLVGQEIEMSNSIKNTIYDNYYDLVKVNSLLETLNSNSKDPQDQLQQSLYKLAQLSKP